MNIKERNLKSLPYWFRQLWARDFPGHADAHDIETAGMIAAIVSDVDIIESPGAVRHALGLVVRYPVALEVYFTLIIKYYLECPVLNYADRILENMKYFKKEEIELFIESIKRQPLLKGRKQTESRRHIRELLSGFSGYYKFDAAQ